MSTQDWRYFDRKISPVKKEKLWGKKRLKGWVTHTHTQIKTVKKSLLNWSCPWIWLMCSNYIANIEVILKGGWPCFSAPLLLSSLVKDYKMQQVGYRLHKTATKKTRATICAVLGAEVDYKQNRGQGDTQLKDCSINLIVILLSPSSSCRQLPQMTWANKVHLDSNIHIA